MTYAICEACSEVARHSGKDDMSQWRTFCDFHRARALQDRVVMSTIPINTNVKPVKLTTVKPPAPPGMF